MPREEKRNAVEWLVFGLGTTLTLAIAAFLLVEAFDDPGSIRLRVSLEVRPAEDGVSVHVHNSGGAAAVDVTVEVCDSDDECRDLLFPDVPSEGDRAAVALFGPDASGFTARVTSYRGMNGEL